MACRLLKTGAFVGGNTPARLPILSDFPTGNYGAVDITKGPVPYQELALLCLRGMTND